MERIGEAGSVDWDHRAVTYDALSWVNNTSLLDWIAGLFYGAMMDCRRDYRDGPATRRSILEIGCGTGALTERLTGGNTVLAIDPSEEMLARARKRAPHATFRVGRDPDQLPEGPFSAVVSRMVLHHVADNNGEPEKAVRRWMDLCAPGCPLIVAEGPPPVPSLPGTQNWYHPANELYRAAMDIKEPGRHVFDANDVARWMLYTGAPGQSVRVAVHERWSHKNSVRQWVQAGGLPSDDQERILKLHRDAHPDAKAVYGIEVTDDGDVTMNWRHAVVVGTRG